MVSREELLKSKEYWIALIHTNLWNVNGSIEKESDKWEKLAEKVVDKFFMKSINELSGEEWKGLFKSCQGGYQELKKDIEKYRKYIDSNISVIKLLDQNKKLIETIENNILLQKLQLKEYIACVNDSDGITESITELIEFNEKIIKENSNETI